MTAPLMPKATAVWLVENTTLTFKQIGDFCELHELEVQAIADGDVAFNIVGLNPVTGGQLTADEIARCEQDPSASLVGVEPERNVKAENSKNKKVLSPSQRSDKPAAILWILRNCPEIIDSQICKLIGTTKPTIASLRDGTHRDMANLRPKNPVAVGLCKEKDLDEAIAVSKKWTELKSQPKKTVKKKAGKSADFPEFFFHRQGRCGTRHLLFLLPAETAARRQKCILRFGPHSRENENREHPQMLPIFALSI